jgi:hypothetical protein
MIHLAKFSLIYCAGESVETGFEDGFVYRSCFSP